MKKLYCKPQMYIVCVETENVLGPNTILDYHSTEAGGTTREGSNVVDFDNGTVLPPRGWSLWGNEED